MNFTHFNQILFVSLLVLCLFEWIAFLCYSVSFLIGIHEVNTLSNSIDRSLPNLDVTPNQFVFSNKFICFFFILSDSVQSLSLVIFLHLLYYSSLFSMAFPYAFINSIRLQFHCNFKCLRMYLVSFHYVFLIIYLSTIQIISI